MQPQSIAITSGKGGVGKTYLSINLAVAIQRLNQRVLLFDSDLLECFIQASIKDSFLIFFASQD